jgi:hypothetical protein
MGSLGMGRSPGYVTRDDALSYSIAAPTAHVEVDAQTNAPVADRGETDVREFSWPYEKGRFSVWALGVLRILADPEVGR